MVNDIVFTFISAQLVKSEIWHSNGIKSDRSTNCISSIVLDSSNGLSHQKSLKDNGFIYRFVPQMVPSHNVYVSNGDSVDAPSPPRDGLDCTLKIGDFVVRHFSFVELIYAMHIY